MKRELFNDGWVFYASGGTSLENTVSGTPEPKSVKLPHDAMIAQKRDPHNPTGNATGYYPYRTVHYMKDFEVKDASEEIFLEFDGVYMNTAVYINGTLAAQHINGYTSFTVHITPYLRQGKNTVKVLVRNGVPSSRWYTGTGIYANMTELIRLMATKEVGSPLEEAFSYLDAAGYNYAPYRYSADIENYPGRIIIGSESYPAALYDNWALCEKLPQVIGDFGWSAWDYIGEAGVGQHHYGETSDFDLYGAYPWKTANCGDFDLIGDRRPISYWREIVWGLRMAPYICVQDPMHFGEKQSPTRWGWSDAIRSWNWRGFEGKPIAVEVYSNADEVELFYNGRSVGIKTPTKCKAVFETVYAPGTLTAVSRRNHVETGKDTLMTASYDVHIKWERKGRGIIEISVVDESGLLNPDADMDVHAENEVEILGFGSANPKSEENYFDRTIKTYKGRALLVMREGEESNGYNEVK